MWFYTGATRCGAYTPSNECWYPTYLFSSSGSVSQTVTFVPQCDNFGYVPPDSAEVTAIVGGWPDCVIKPMPISNRITITH